MDALVRLDTERFDELRNRRGLTRRQVAEAAGIDETQLSQACSGKRRLQVSTIQRLAVALNGFPELPAFVAELTDLPPAEEPPQRARKRKAAEAPEAR